MAYAPPDITGIDFVMASGYTPPAIDAIWFTPGNEGPETIRVECPAMEGRAGLSAGILWFAEAAGLSSAAVVPVPGMALLVHAPVWSAGSVSSATVQRRVRLLSPLTAGSGLFIQGIAVAPEGVEVVSPWPLMSGSALALPDVSVQLFCPPMVCSSDVAVAFITAGETTHISPPAFLSRTGLSFDLRLGIAVPPWMSAGGLSILAIRTMPEGDQYLACPGFLSTSTLSAGTILSEILVPALQASSTLGEPGIFSGVNVDCEPFACAGGFGASVLVAVATAGFAAAGSIDGSTMVMVDACFQSSGTLSDVVVYDGDYVALPAFVSRSTLSAGLSLILFTEPLAGSAALALPVISRFISLSPLAAHSVLAPTAALQIVPIESADVYYFFALDGLEIPISSFQCRMRGGGGSTFLQAVIPGMEYAADVADRAGGEMVVSMGYRINGEILRIRDIVSATMTGIATYRGGLSQSIIVSGHATATYDTEAVTLNGGVYCRTNDGKRTYRFAEPSLTLAPGAVVTVAGETFTAGMVSYFISVDSKTMEVTEA